MNANRILPPESVPDQPGCDDYVGMQATNNNSLVDQAVNTEA